MDLPLYHIAASPHAADLTRLVLLLHGYGANERDLYDLAAYFGEDTMTLSLRAPLSLDGHQSFAWFAIGMMQQELLVDIPQAHQSLALLIDCIEQASRAYRVEPHQVLLVGFSQGATMAALAALTRPDLVAGAAILSGIEPAAFLSDPLDTATLATRRFLVTHGTQDMVVPIGEGRSTRTFLSDLGADVTYHEYRMGHGISEESLHDLAAWVRAEA